MGKKRRQAQREVWTREKIEDFCNHCLYSDWGAYSEMLAAIGLELLKHLSDPDLTMEMPTRGERHKMWNDYMDRRREEELDRLTTP
jgi:hypothetical protein